MSSELEKFTVIIGKIKNKSFFATGKNNQQHFIEKHQQPLANLRRQHT